MMVDEPQYLPRVAGEVGRKFRRDHQVDTAMAHARHVEMTPRLGAREDLLARIVAKGHRHDLRLVTARVERGGQLAHEDLGAAVHERHLRLKDQDAEASHYVACRKLMMSPSWTMYSLPSRRSSPWSRQAAIVPRAMNAS